jgi:hypothetical protein
VLTPEGAGSGGVVGRRPRHMHKRSSSLNDLPKLEVIGVILDGKWRF